MLEKSITYGQELLVLIPTSNRMRRILVDLLLELYQDRFELKQNVTDLDLCIQLCREELELESAHLHGNHRHTLASLMIQRFKLDPDMQHIAEAIDLYIEELACCPESDPAYYNAVNDLAQALDIRFGHQGNRTDIDREIELHQQALDHTRPDFNAKIDSLNNLALGLYTRFTNFGQEQDQADLNKAIILYEEALSLRSTTGSQRLNSLDGLGFALKTRFQQQGSPADIDLAVNLHQKALELCPRANAKRAMCLNTLANIIHTRFTVCGDSKDLDHAIKLHEEALKLHGSPDPARAMSLNNLALAVKSRFEQRGDMRDIDIAVELNRKALALCSNSHLKNRPMFLNNLAIAVHARGRERGQKTDIEEAIHRHREALLLLPAEHSDRRTYLQNLASVLQTRFLHFGSMADMDEALEHSRHALSLCPPTHSKHAMFLNNLAGNLLKRFDLQGNSVDNEEALQHAKEGMRLFLFPHPYYSNALGIYASALQNKINPQSTQDDIDEVIQLRKDILQLFPSPHPDHGRLLGKLGQSLMISYERIPQDSVIAEAMLAFEKAAKYTSGSPLARFNYATYWAKTANQYNHPSALKAYRMAINYLPTLAALDLNLQSRQEVLGNLSQDSLLSDAAICAIGEHKYEDAVQLLEAGRSIFWSQALRLHTPLEDLQRIHPELASKVSALLKELERGAFREIAQDPLSDTGLNVIAMEAEGTRLRRHNDELEEALASVRQLSGFESFMQPKSISSLRDAATHGTVVILITGHTSCHLLLVKASTEIQHVPLADGTTAEYIASLAQAIGSLSRGRDERNEQRLIGKKVYAEHQHPNDRFGAVLKILWDLIATPVIKTLKLEKSLTPPRLWWCPTGPFVFLPLHAAGIYTTENSQSVSDYVISSYTPTLTALLSSPVTPTSFKVTTVIQPTTPGHPSLPYTTEELAQVLAKVPREWVMSLGSAEAPTSVNAVLDHLKDSLIIHFACHGVQDSKHPLDSGLLIANDQLKVSQIMESTSMLSNGQKGLAFLSACETAMGDGNIPDEALHLAATLLFAGFQSIVATMWTMSDKDGPEVTKWFYSHLFRNAKATSNPPVFPDLRESAEALHLAVAKLRSKVPFARWVPFVHYGL
ncbi:CHAT domain-containing protein [Mycena rebaudengoi]|nr:CHAT domain-containing protein [Mycena rebaudengoi]